MKNKIAFLCLIFLYTTIFSNAQTANIAGQVATFSNTLMPNTTVHLIGDNFNKTALTDENGNYLFTDIPTGATYTLQLEKESAALNGVSTLDLVRIHQVIIHVEQLSAFSFLAGDVNESGTVSVLDALLLQRLILGLTTTPDMANWRFYPADFDLEEGWNRAPSSKAITLMDSVEGVDFVGYKLGDVTGNANVN